MADEVERLRQWKAEATKVMNGWMNVWHYLGRPGELGQPIHEATLQAVMLLDQESDDAKVRRLATRIADITTKDEQAQLAVWRVLDWCDQQDAISKGESLTTKAVRQQIDPTYTGDPHEGA